MGPQGITHFADYGKGVEYAKTSKPIFVDFTNKHV